jgi:hypothetical protein
MSEGLEGIPSLEGLEPEPYHRMLNGLRKLYQEMETALSVEKHILHEERRASNEKDPVAYEEWEHLLYDEREYDLEECERLRAEFVVVFLAEAVRRLLSEVRFELGETGGSLVSRAGRKRSAKRRNKRRGDWLEPFREFFSGFNIHLDQGPGWAAVQEVAMARDAVVHRSILDREGAPPFLAPKEFADAIGRLWDFCTWLRAEVRAAVKRDRMQSEGPL